MSSTTIQAKVYFPNQQIRRISFSHETEFSEFKQTLIEAYESSPLFVPVEYDAQLLYLDDEHDWIMVNTQPEWTAAVNNLHEKELLRVKVLISRKKSENAGLRNRGASFVPCRRFALENPLFAFLAKIGEEIELEGSENSSTPQQQSNQSDTSFSEQQEAVNGGVQEAQQRDEKQVPNGDHLANSETGPCEVSNITEKSYDTELQLLESMGFTNRNLNKHLLHSFGGDLRQVASSLVDLN